ncbi:hypothetical protein F5148DRAFT_83009 [Russula earlei]|uniref:Uncharacterized protein n=1 Tax=Russula earlei TaxID=71964 RepID=A0ACC0U7R3_9AGAM|nr:hypothetical protein F5148DRAFT_83009 [Russula earlei]
MSARGVSVQASGETVAQGGGVLFKLVIFSLSLGIVPISSYFASEKYIWNGNSTFAAITAVVAANAVLVAYIVTSLRDDRAEQEAGKPLESRKDRVSVKTYMIWPRFSVIMSRSAVLMLLTLLATPFHAPL